MANKLENPTNYEHSERPSPIKKEQRQGNNDHRDSNCVRQTVHRVPMFGFVVGDEIVLHKWFPNSDSWS
jgi:hypothetical protein